MKYVTLYEIHITKENKMKTSYITLPNSLLDMKLTANELAVLFYISSIYSGKKQVRVRQAVIARRCGIKTTQTVSRITASLAMITGFSVPISKTGTPACSPTT